MQFLKKKEKLILAYMRLNSRENLTRISRKTKIPVSTIFDKLKKYEQSVIKKNTCLLDFKALGYGVKVNILMSVSKANRFEISQFVLKNRNTNSFFRINNGYDFMVEAIFRNMDGLQTYLDKLSEFKAKNIKTHFILDEIKREIFLSNPNDLSESILI